MFLLFVLISLRINLVLFHCCNDVSDFGASDVLKVKHDVTEYEDDIMTTNKVLVQIL